MQCLDVEQNLLAAERDVSGEIAAHLSGCATCAELGARTARLDAYLQPLLVVSPPPHLQAALLSATAATANRDSSLSWVWAWARSRDLTPRALLPQLVAGLAIAFALVQLGIWLLALNPVVGNVSEALDLLATTPVLTYVSLPDLNLQSLALWLTVGLATWLVSGSPRSGRLEADRA